MVSYHNVHYWLSDFHSDGRVVGKEETFNQCHIRLKNVIKRVFCIVEVCFSILKRMIPYSFIIQTKIIIICFSNLQFFSINLCRK